MLSTVSPAPEPLITQLGVVVIACTAVIISISQKHEHKVAKFKSWDPPLVKAFCIVFWQVWLRSAMPFWMAVACCVVQ